MISDNISSQIQSQIDKYTQKVIDAMSQPCTEAEMEAKMMSVIMSIPEAYRAQVMMGIMSGMTGDGNTYSTITISPYNSIQSMIIDMRSCGYIGKTLSARHWGNAGDLAQYEEKADLLKDWIRLVKVLKTLRDNSSSSNYSIQLRTDLSGNQIDNTSYKFEVSGSTIILHTNCYFYNQFNMKVKVESEPNKRSVLTQLAEDVECMVEDLSQSFFTWNQTNDNCPSYRLEEIHSECNSLALK